jgi:hypothetical protein
MGGAGNSQRVDHVVRPRYNSLMLVAKARVRIAQASQLLEQLGGHPSAERATDTVEACLEVADALWRQLAALRDNNSEFWGAVDVDGCQADQVLSRLNDIVYELLVSITSRSPASSGPAVPPPPPRTG